MVCGSYTLICLLSNGCTGSTRFWSIFYLPCIFSTTPTLSSLLPHFFIAHPRHLPAATHTQPYPAPHCLPSALQPIHSRLFIRRCAFRFCSTFLLAFSYSGDNDLKPGPEIFIVCTLNIRCIILFILPPSLTLSMLTTLTFSVSLKLG